MFERIKNIGKNFKKAGVKNIAKGFAAIVAMELIFVFPALNLVGAVLKKVAK